MKLKQLLNIVSKVVILIIALIFVFSFVHLDTKADTFQTSDSITVNQARIRTTGKHGIQFEACYKGYTAPTGKSIAKYGLLIAFGETEINNSFNMGATTINGKSVKHLEQDYLDDPVNEKVNLVIWDIPEAYYSQDFTCRAYVILDDNYPVYGTGGLVRNLAQVAINAHEQPDYIEAENIVKYVYDALQFIEVDDNQIAKINASNPDLFVNPSFNTTNKTVYIKKNSTATSNLNKIYAVYPYTSFTSALAKAKAGDTIYGFASNYSEDFSITKEDITIVGNNYGVAGTATRGSETNFTGKISVTGSGATFDGIGLSGNASIQIDGSIDGITYQNIYSTSAGVTAKLSDDHNRKPVLTNDNYTVSNVKLLDSYFNIGSSIYCVSALCFYGKTTNLEVKNNYFTNTSSPDISEAVYLTTAYGTINVQNNQFIYPTSSKVMILGHYINACTKIDIIDNVFSKNNSKTTAGIGSKKLATGSIFNVTHNSFIGVTGDTFDFESSNTGSTQNIRYNYFDDDTEYKITKSGSGVINYAYNCYKKAQYTDTSDYNMIRTLEQYNTVYENRANKQYGSITYELDGGTNPANTVNTYEKGIYYTLPTPTKAGFQFLGWSEVAGSEPYITQLDKDETRTLTLYANWLAASVNYAVKDSEVASLNALKPDIIVNSAFTGGTITLTGTGLDSYYVDNPYDYGTNAFSSIKNAITAATAGQTVYLFSGTYATTVALNKAITLAGPNYNVLGTATRNDEAVISDKITISVANAIINGISTTGSANITITASNVTVKNIYATYSGSKESDYIILGSAQSNTLIEGCKTKHTGTARFIFCNDYTITSPTIKNNYIEGKIYDSVSPYADGIRLIKIAGTVTILSNTIIGFDQYPINLGSTSNSATQIDIINNNISYGGNYGYLVMVRNIKSTASVNCTYNTFSNVKGSGVLDFRGTISNNVLIKYNKFMDTIGSTPSCYLASDGKAAAFSVQYNYFATTPTTTTVKTTGSIVGTYTLVSQVPKYK